MAQNTSLHDFLDSYLQFRHRWYDLPHRSPKGAVAGLVVGELELCRRVFMVLYRMWDFLRFSFSLQPFTMSHLFVLTYDMLPFCVLDPQTRILEQVVLSPLVWRNIQVGLVLLIYSSCGVYWGAHRSQYNVFTIPQCSFVALLMENFFFVITTLPS